MHWSVRSLLLSTVVLLCLIRVSAGEPVTCKNQEEMFLFIACANGKWTGTYSMTPDAASGQSKEVQCCSQIYMGCYFVQYTREKCESSSKSALDDARKRCADLGVNWSPEMCAKQEANLQPLRENCKPVEKWIKCSDPEKVMSGGIALATNWINWLIVMMTVIVVKYFI